MLQDPNPNLNPNPNPNPKPNPNPNPHPNPNPNQVRMLKAPPWLFSAESDEYHHTRVTAEHWHVDPPPQALIHFVCSRWPGSGGRKVATAAPDPRS